VIERPFSRGPRPARFGRLGWFGHFVAEAYPDPSCGASLDAEIIAELVNMAKSLRESQGRGEKLHLSEEELAFYDALEVNDSAVRSWATKPCARLHLSWWMPSAATPLSTGLLKRASAPACVPWSSAFSAPTATRPINRKKPHKLFWPRQN